MIEKKNKYKKIGDKLIKSYPEFEHILDNEIKIAYLASDEIKIKNHKIIFADCNKVSEHYKWCCKYDFFIIVYEPNILLFNDKQIEILIRHELNHIGVSHEGSQPSYYIVPHDVEEFNNIIADEGLYWER